MRCRQARAMTQLMLNRCRTPDARRVYLLNCLAWMDLMLDDPELLDEADVAAAEAYALLPWEASSQSTHGLVLIERGLFDQGIPLLRAALRADLPLDAEASVLSSLAITRFRRSETEAARKLMERARRRNRENPALARADRTVFGNVPPPPAL